MHIEQVDHLYMHIEQVDHLYMHIEQVDHLYMHIEQACVSVGGCTAVHRSLCSPTQIQCLSHSQQQDTTTLTAGSVLWKLSYHIIIIY